MGNPVLSTPIGHALEGVIVTQQDHDLERLIAYCRDGTESAHAEGRSAMAIYWARRMTEAMQQRRDVIKAAWDRRIEREIDNGVGYFSSQQAQELAR